MANAIDARATTSDARVCPLWVRRRRKSKTCRMSSVIGDGRGSRNPSCWWLGAQASLEAERGDGGGKRTSVPPRRRKDERYDRRASRRLIRMRQSRCSAGPGSGAVELGSRAARAVEDELRRQVEI